MAGTHIAARNAPIDELHCNRAATMFFPYRLTIACVAVNIKPDWRPANGSTLRSQAGQILESSRPSATGHQEQFTYNGPVKKSKDRNPLMWAGVAAALLLASANWPARAQSKRVLGVTEMVRLEPEGVLVIAKLDTGASMTSLDARAIRIVERNTVSWVRFDYHDGSGRIVQFERPLVRIAVVRPAPDTVERRPVVMMNICLGGVRREVQVNLVDRSSLNTRMLIGRNFLTIGQITVDSALALTAKPACDGGGA